jgi:hypothetical protein
MFYYYVKIHLESENNFLKKPKNYFLIGFPFGKIIEIEQIKPEFLGKLPLFKNHKINRKFKFKIFCVRSHRHLLHYSINDHNHPSPIPEVGFPI